jgi:hypothetical protein
VIGIDNSVARYALEKGSFSADDALCDEIVELLARCAAMGSAIRVVQVPGTMQAADELSRNKEHDTAKITACLDLMSRAAGRLQWLRDLSRDSKRQRADDGPGNL